MNRIRRCSWQQSYSWEIRTWRAVAETKPQRGIVYRTDLHTYRTVRQMMLPESDVISSYHAASWVVLNVV